VACFKEIIRDPKTLVMNGRVRRYLRMEIPETLATLDTQDKERRETKQKRNVSQHNIKTNKGSVCALLLSYTLNIFYCHKNPRQMDKTQVVN
jgi:hypothetical protein